MGNPQHLQWLLEGVPAWNARRKKENFKPDFESVDLQAAFEAAGKLTEAGRIPLDSVNLGAANLKKATLEWADLVGADLARADFEGANLGGADLGGAKLREADLRRANLARAYIGLADLRVADMRGADHNGVDLVEADLTGVDVRTVLPAADEGEDGAPEPTDLSRARFLTQDQVDTMRGDSGTILPDGLTRPPGWPELDDVRVKGDPARPPVSAPATRYTPPAAFTALGNAPEVRYAPERPEPRAASATPIDLEQCERTRRALLEQVRTFARALRKYAREGRDSNRVGIAEQLLVTVEALQSALTAEVEAFLPTLLEDYIEAMAEAMGESIHAFETSDVGAFKRLVKRARQHYACYPELVEIGDPANTRFITDDFPYSLPQLSSVIHEIAYSEEGLQLFTDATRVLIEAEQAARVPREADEQKTKQARLSALVGEMWSEMKKLAGRSQDMADKGAAWARTWDKVEAVWDAIKPFVGNTG